MSKIEREPFEVAIFGERCCCRRDVDRWEDAVVTAAREMMEKTNRVAKLVSLHPRSVAMLSREVDHRMRRDQSPLESVDGSVASETAIVIYTSVGPVAVVPDRAMPLDSIFVASQDDIDRINESMQWMRAARSNAVSREPTE